MNIVDLQLKQGDKEVQVSKSRGIITSRGVITVSENGCVLGDACTKMDVLVKHFESGPQTDEQILRMR